MAAVVVAAVSSFIAVRSARREAARGRAIESSGLLVTLERAQGNARAPRLATHPEERRERLGTPRWPGACLLASLRRFGCQRPRNRLGLALDRPQQGEHRRIRLAAVPLPVPKRFERDAEALGELSLAQPMRCRMNLARATR